MTPDWQDNQITLVGVVNLGKSIHFDFSGLCLWLLQSVVCLSHSVLFVNQGGMEIFVLQGMKLLLQVPSCHLLQHNKQGGLGALVILLAVL